MILEKLLGKVILIGGLSLFGYNCQNATSNFSSYKADVSNLNDADASSGKYTCETACTHLKFCCDNGFLKSGTQYDGKYFGGCNDGFDKSCVYGCSVEKWWSQKATDCISVICMYDCFQNPVF